MPGTRMNGAPRSEILASDRMICWKELHQRVGLSYSTIRRLERKGRFPKRVRLSDNRVAWVLREVFEWMDEKKRSRAA